MKYKRILIFGGPGTGKNWLGERLSEKRGIKFYDTDDMAWKKRFTVKRSWNEKYKMLRATAKKERWIIGTGATSYIEPAVKRANLIVVLRANFFVTTYRILRRQIIHSRTGKERSQHGLLAQAWQNLLRYIKKDKQKEYVKELKKKYSSKVVEFSQGEKKKFLDERK